MVYLCKRVFGGPESRIIYYGECTIHAYWPLACGDPLSGKIFPILHVGGGHQERIVFAWVHQWSNFLASCFGFNGWRL